MSRTVLLKGKIQSPLETQRQGNFLVYNQIHYITVPKGQKDLPFRHIVSCPEADSLDLES